jgi:predicted RecA/RadA family phage recombinase
MKNYVLGGDTIQFVLAANCLAGDIINIGAAMSGVAMNSGSTGDTIAVKLRGVFTLPKTTSLVITAGDEVYFNTGTGKVTKTKTDKCLGVAWQSALTNDTTIEVLLVPKRGEQGLETAQAAFVAQIATVNATDLPTAEALANQNKATVNALLTSLINAGVMAAS